MYRLVPNRILSETFKTQDCKKSILSQAVDDIGYETAEGESGSHDISPNQLDFQTLESIQNWNTF